MENCPFSWKQIQLGIQESIAEASPPDSSSERAATDAELESMFETQEALLGELQQEFKSRLPELLTAAYNPEYSTIELIEETEARYLFRVSPAFWSPIQDEFEIGDAELRVVQSVYEQFVPVPNGWRPLIVSKPEPYQNGKKAVATELRALLSGGMPPDDAAAFITRKHGIGPSLNPYVIADGKQQSVWDEIPPWKSDLQRES